MKENEPTQDSAEAVPTRADGRRLIARDSRNIPLISAYPWTDDAVKRVLRVPGGFMRDRTQNRVEEVAVERDATTIDLELVEAGIEHSRQLMAQMVESYEATPEISRAESEKQQTTTAKPQDNDQGSDTAVSSGLNEIGVMAALQKARKASIH